MAKTTAVSFIAVLGTFPSLVGPNGAHQQVDRITECGDDDVETQDKDRGSSRRNRTSVLSIAAFGTFPNLGHSYH